MFDILALVLITIFVPLIVLVGVKLYKYENTEKLIKVFAILLFAFDLFRFFYNARFFPSAKTPAPELKFSYLTIYSIVMLFAAYNKGKFGDFMRKAAMFTCLMPMVLGIFNPEIYTSSFDTYAVLKAVYYIESGLGVLLAILIGRNSKTKIEAINILYCALFACGYALINFLSIKLWVTNYQINPMWYVQMIVCVASVAVVYLAYFVCNKKCKATVAK